MSIPTRLENTTQQNNSTILRSSSSSNHTCNIPPSVYSRLLQNQHQLTQYLKYIRHKQPVPKISVNSLSLGGSWGTNSPISTANALMYSNSNSQYANGYNKGRRDFSLNKSTYGNGSGRIARKDNSEVRVYIEVYLRLVKEVLALQSYLGKKIIKKVLQFLYEFPTMNFLLEVVNSFGKDKKKVSLNQANILAYANDDMVPLFQKIIEKIEYLKKEGQSKKLLQLGHRIEHLQTLIDSTKHKVTHNAEHSNIFRSFEPDRVQKYMLMEENLNKAQKNFGDFSTNFVKNKEIFSNLNKVYLKIKNSSNSGGYID